MHNKNNSSTSKSSTVRRSGMMIICIIWHVYIISMCISHWMRHHYRLWTIPVGWLTFFHVEKFWQKAKSSRNPTNKAYFDRICTEDFCCMKNRFLFMWVGTNVTNHMRLTSVLKRIFGSNFGLEPTLFAEVRQALGVSAPSSVANPSTSLAHTEHVSLDNFFFNFGNVCFWISIQLVSFMNFWVQAKTIEINFEILHIKKKKH